MHIIRQIIRYRNELLTVIKMLELKGEDERTVKTTGWSEEAVFCSTHYFNQFKG